jgi:hypothetical protein
VIVPGGIGTVGAIARRPRLWSTALRQVRNLAPTGWWRRWPFLPVPAKDYVAFRALTQYGEIGRPPSPEDVVDYLAWCREWASTLRR